MGLSDEELNDLYTWSALLLELDASKNARFTLHNFYSVSLGPFQVDEIPLSRPKRNIARDFSDAVLVAEVIYHHFPKEVQLHNYSAANSFAQKMYNWSTLNGKVCRKLGITIPKHECEAAARAAPMAIERILLQLRSRLAELSASAVMPRTSETEGASSEIAAFKPRSGPVAEPAQVAVVRQPSPRLVHDTHTTGSDELVRELREMNEIQCDTEAGVHLLAAGASHDLMILETKTRKLEQLVRLKDAKIETLLAKMEAAGIH